MLRPFGCVDITSRLAGCFAARTCTTASCPEVHYDHQAITNICNELADFWQTANRLSTICSGSLAAAPEACLCAIRHRTLRGGRTSSPQ